MPHTQTWQSIVDHVGLVLGAVILFRLTMFLKNKKERDTRTIKVWLFGLFASVFVVFELDEVYLGLDRRLGLNNVSWLLAYLCLVESAYLLGAFCSQESPRWALPGLIVTAASLAAAFYLGPARAPECANHYIAANVGEVVFTALAYGYVATMVIAVSFPPLVAIYRRSEHEPLARLRTIVGMLAASASVAFYAFRIVVFSLSLVVPSMQTFAASSAGGVYRVVTVVAAALWIIFFGTSDRPYLTLTRPVKYVQNILALRRLNALKARIDRFVGSSPSLPRTSWLEALRNPDLHIYQALIAILDGRKILVAWQKQQGQELTAPGSAETEEAVHLIHGLHSVPDSLDYEHLVDAFCRLEKCALAAPLKGRAWLKETAPVTI